MSRVPTAHPPCPQGCWLSSLCLHFSLNLEAADWNYLLLAVSACPEPHSQLQHLPESPRQPQLESDKASSLPWVHPRWGGRERTPLSHIAAEPSQPVTLCCLGPKATGGIPHSTEAPVASGSYRDAHQRTLQEQSWAGPRPPHCSLITSRAGDFQPIERYTTSLTSDSLSSWPSSLSLWRKYLLCNPEAVSAPLWTSVTSSVQWKTRVGDLGWHAEVCLM